jgi:hypothetical protein
LFQESPSKSTDGLPENAFGDLHEGLTGRRLERGTQVALNNDPAVRLVDINVRAIVVVTLRAAVVTGKAVQVISRHDAPSSCTGLIPATEPRLRRPH